MRSLFQIFIHDFVPTKLERCFASHENACNYTDSPNVHFLVVILLFHHLRCHVHPTSDNLVNFLIFLYNTSRIESSDFACHLRRILLKEALPVHQHIFKFQSAVDDVGLMEMIDSFDNLVDPICSSSFCEINPSLL